jgi:hypothetical protein
LEGVVLGSFTRNIRNCMYLQIQIRREARAFVFLASMKWDNLKSPSVSAFSCTYCFTHFRVTARVLYSTQS